MGDLGRAVRMDAGVARSRTANEAAVRAVEEAYDSAWNAGDITAILEVLTDGVVITNPYGETTTGRAEVERFFTTLFSGVAKGSRHSSQIRAVHFVTADVALVDAEAVISDFGPGPEPVRHSFTDVLVRTADGWRIDHVRAFVFMPRPVS
jgi:uncharacterized protein (TIGR02246 family)